MPSTSLLLAVVVLLPLNARWCPPLFLRAGLGNGDEDGSHGRYHSDGVGDLVGRKIPIKVAASARTQEVLALARMEVDVPCRTLDR